VDFIDSHKDRREPDGLRWGVEPICAVLCEHGVKIAPSTFYEWKGKAPTARQARDEELMVKIKQVYDDNFQVYGARKVWLVLNREGTEGARCTVERLMRQMGWKGVHRGKVKRTTSPGDNAELPSDLVNRRFNPLAPNQLWVEDFTYVSTWSGWVYVAFVIDAYARRILGWRTSTTMNTDMVLDALNQALWQREREGHDDYQHLIAHSDHGVQYTSIRYSERVDQAGLKPSTGTVGDSYDNALAETINGLYKTELVKRHGPWRNADDLEYATAEWVDWFNYRRLYEYCGDRPPVECENLYYANHQDMPQSVAVPV
jgi:putative transposase